MTLSFRTRLAFRWMLAFGLLLAGADAAIYAGIRVFLYTDLDGDLRTVAATELASASDEPGGAHLHEFSPDPSNPAYDQKFVQLLDRNGHLLMQSPGLRAARPVVDSATIVDGLAGRMPLRFVSVDGRSGRVLALRTAGPDRYLVVVGLFTEQLETTLRRLRQLLGAVWVGAMLVTGVIGFALASSALAPVRRITARAETIARGDFTARLDPPTVDDEIGRMTRLLNQMIERLFQALDANRRFAAHASHELRSPLAAVLGEVEVVLKRPRTVEEYRQSLGRVHERLQQLAGLTEDLMLLVRAQERKAGVVSEVPVRAAVDRVVSGLVSLASEQQVRIDVSVPADLVAYGDPRLLERVFDNLVRNAVQYTGERGEVTVGAALVGRSGGWTTDELVVTVRDTGPGIPAEERERVFERFHRLDASRSRRTGGTGLGLSIAREIVRLFDGSIQVIDTAGPGATFEVRLPGGHATGATQQATA